MNEYILTQTIYTNTVNNKTWHCLLSNLAKQPTVRPFLGEEIKNQLPWIQNLGVPRTLLVLHWDRCQYVCILYF